MGKLPEISIARQKCLCVSGKVVVWSKHFDIVILVPMSYLKLRTIRHSFVCLLITYMAVSQIVQPLKINELCLDNCSQRVVGQLLKSNTVVPSSPLGAFVVLHLCFPPLLYFFCGGGSQTGENKLWVVKSPLGSPRSRFGYPTGPTQVLLCVYDFTFTAVSTWHSHYRT